MGKTLVVVESPAKAKTIKKYLGAGYEVLASKGHVKDLPKKMGIDFENGFQETYEVVPGKEKVLAELKSAAKDADDILLATDPDREGEAIAWHLAEELTGKPLKAKRVEFHEITKSGVLKGVASPRKLNKPLYDAQRARRVLDRIVGYDVSALVWSKLAFGLSAGRVQSVALRLIVDKERRVAFVRQAVSDTRFPAMIERRRFNLVDSAVIVYLRRRIAESAGTGRHIVVSLDEIRDELLSFRQLRNTNEAGRRRDIDNSVTRMKSHGILKKLRDSDDRYTIAPVLTVLFPLEEINALLAALRSVSDGTAGDLTEEPDGEQTDD